LFLDFTGYYAGTLSFDWASVNNSTGDRKGSLRVYTSTDGTTFTELSGAAVLNFTNNSLTSGSVTSVALPSGFDNIATARIRFYECNGSGGATGSRPKISIDNVSVSSSGALPVQLTNFSALATHLAAELVWSTATEKNNYGFEIERRLVGPTNWQKVGFVAGAGTSSSPRGYSFVDANLASGRYAYRLKQIDHDGTFRYSSAAEVEVGLAPSEFKLEPNFPNPFNPSTTIEFTLGMDGHASLRVYNVLGQEVATLFDDVAQAGRVYPVKFDASRLPSGVYFAKLEARQTNGGQAGKQQTIRKMMLLK
jgi:hypothetical protein